MLLAHHLAGFVEAMRSIALPDAPMAYRGGPLGLLDAPTRTAIERLRGIPEENVGCDAVTAIWEQALQAEGFRAGSWETTWTPALAIQSPAQRRK